MADNTPIIDSITEKDKIQILISEYTSLRSEIVSRIAFGFQTTTIAISLMGIVFTQTSGRDRAIAMSVGAILLFLAMFFNMRDVGKISARIRQIEADVNKRVGT